MNDWCVQIVPNLAKVHAHGGGMLQDANGTFWWHGESEKVFTLGIDFLSSGVNLYSSQDLVTWQFQGLVFNSSAQIAGMPYGPPYRTERPKVGRACCGHELQHACTHACTRPIYAHKVVLATMQSMLTSIAALLHLG